MKSSLYCLLLVIAVTSTAAVAQNQEKSTDTQVVSEALTGAVTLPASAEGSLVMAPCAGCPLKSFRATATTTYFIGDRPVTLAELKADAIRRSKSILTVAYMLRSSTLLSVSAEPPTRRQLESR